MLPHRLQSTNKTGSGPQGIDTPGTLWTWGINTAAELGNNTVISRSSPVQIGFSNVWVAIASGRNHNLGLQSNGTLWTWGSNLAGTLGQNNTTSISSPVQVGSPFTWRAVAAAGISTNGHNVALTTEGALWAWGRNGDGQLGTNDGVTRSSPVQVGSLTDWDLIVCGTTSTFAIKKDNTLWSWGNNNQGVLGLNDAIANDRSSPAQIGTAADWAKIVVGNYHALAIKTDGTLWSWGDNSVGQLGQNIAVATDRSSPAQIGTASNWVTVAAGQYTSFAVNSSGQLWSWGQGSNGRTGQNDAANRSSPAQVGSLTDWQSVAVGSVSYHALAIKTDGTLWSWGTGASGQLGSNTAATRSSPAQVGTLKNWGQVTIGRDHTLAIQLPGDDIEFGGDAGVATKLLLHCDGTDGSTTLTDSSLIGHTFTANGNAQIDTAQSKFGGASALFDGTGDFFVSSAHTHFNFQRAGDWTIDFWFRSSSLSGDRTMFHFPSSGTQGLHIKTSGTALIVDNGAVASAISAGSLSTNTWYHVAVTRVSTTITLYLDGTAIDTDTAQDYIDANGTANIGRFSNGTEFFSGWIDEVRISKGIARWTANFTPPTSAYS